MTSDLPFSWFYVVELICSVLYLLTFAVDLATKGTLHIAGERIYGYTIVMDAVGMGSWAFSLVLICREKVCAVMSRPHGLALVLFWLMTIMWLGLEVGNVHHPSWWWALSSRADIADFTLFLLRCTLILVLIGVGLFRPLLCPSKRSSYTLLVNADTRESAGSKGSIQHVGSTSDTRESKEGNFIKMKSNSTFANFLSKSRLLFPYVWPKGTRLEHVTADRLYSILLYLQDILSCNCLL